MRFSRSPAILALTMLLLLALIPLLLLVGPTPSQAAAAAENRGADSSVVLLGGIAAPAASSKGRSTLVREVGIAGAAIGAGFLLDDTFEPGSGVGTIMDNAGAVIGSPLTLGAATGIMALGGWVEHHPPTLVTAKRLALAITTTTVTVEFLKLATQRERPDGSNDQSFPSGHSGASFAAATVLDREYGGAVGWIAYSAAAFVAASRVVGNHHYFSDVVSGAVIGRFYGRLFTHAL